MQNIINIGIPALTLFSYVIILTVIFFSKKDKLIRSYLAYVVVLALWSGTSLLMRLQAPPSVLFWNRAMVFAMILVPVMLFRFSLAYTRSRKPVVWTATLSCAALLFYLNGTGHIVKTASIDSEGNLSFPIDFGAYIFSLFCIVVIASSVLILVAQVKQDKMRYDSVKMTIFGIALMLFSSLLNLSPVIGKYPVDILFCSVNSIMVGYSIFNYRFLDIKFIFKKGLAYAAFMLIIIVIYGSIVYGLQLILHELNVQSYLATSIIVAALIAATLYPGKDLVQKLRNRLYFKEEFNRQQVLKNFNDNLIYILNLNELSEAIILAIQNGILSSRVYFLLSDEEDDGYYVFNSSNMEHIGEKILVKNHPIVRWFSNRKNKMLFVSEIERTPFFKGVWIKETEALKTLDVELIMPVRKREQLIGLIFLSPKSDDRRYYAEDLDMLSNLVNSSAVMIENARLYRQAREEAITDGLTKLFNHKHFYERLKQAVEEEHIEPVSLLMADMDHFKLYNDLYGHFDGDLALEQAADTIKRIVGERGSVYRYGGEEFSVMLPHIESIEALSIAEEIRRGIESWFSQTSENVQKFLTMSIGVSTYPSSALNSDELIKQADIALYDAKMLGKNNCVLYQDSGTSKEDTETSATSMLPAYSMYSSPVYSLAAAIDAKDHYTFNHSKNVARYAAQLGKAVGLGDRRVKLIHQAGLLHDVGKIGIPERILNKPSKLTDYEYNIIKKHVTNSITIIKHSQYLNFLVPAVLYHHERWDGKGYVNLKEGEDIPIEARCLSIADAFDSMVNERPYRKAMTVEAALDEISRGSGSQFDPHLAHIFIRLVQEGEVQVLPGGMDQMGDYGMMEPYL